MATKVDLYINDKKSFTIINTFDLLRVPKILNELIKLPVDKVASKMFRWY